MQTRVEGHIDLQVSSNELQNYNRIVLLLHGYSESGAKIYKRLSPYLNLDQDLILAPNAIFPLVDRFPLETQKGSDELLRGYAWYFYDQKKDEYLVNYSTPVSFLKSYLNSINTLSKPVTVIGYSQGGYLAPFLASEHNLIEDVIGINCSYRNDLFPSHMDKVIDAFQGSDDPIIDIELAKARHLNYGHGDYQLIKDENHRLSPRLAEIVASHYLRKHN